MPESAHVYGLSAPWLLHEGRLVPTVIALSHGEQLERLRRAVPAAAEAAVVVGDPCLDLLVAHRPLRESYRQAFGVRPGQRLVVVASTWGRDSLFGRVPDLPVQLGRELPPDDHSVVVALHPNITAAHSQWQLGLWLGECGRVGVLVLPDHDLWRQAVVAADLVVGDHGSVTFYAAAIGRPVLLASAPGHTVDPRSPVGKLLAAAPRLAADHRAEGTLTSQVDRAITGHDPARLLPATSLATSHPGEADRRLGDVVYAGLGLSPPRSRPDRPGPSLPVPVVARPEPDALVVEVDIAAVDPARPDEVLDVLEVTVSRKAIGHLDRHREQPASVDGTHLVVDTRAANMRLLELADVVVHPAPLDGRAWIAAALRQLHGCRVATAPSSPEGAQWLAGTRDGTLVAFTLEVWNTDLAAVLASVLHVWSLPGTSRRPWPRPLPRAVRARVGARVVTAELTVVSPPA